ncbi:hypothetical protein niasHS_003353 [Heterodera schachtii]|uniref:Uncharacterized protein n=1 Tax=Heterodera schachtii TaxID=97005 RepID=A0ABD2KGQ7_HETSC
MSSQRIARSLSNVHLEQQPKNDCRVRRDGTAPHSLLTVPGVGAIASDESAVGQQNATALWEGDGVAKSKMKKNSVGTNGTSGGTQIIKKWGRENGGGAHPRTNSGINEPIFNC